MKKIILPLIGMLALYCNKADERSTEMYNQQEKSYASKVETIINKHPVDYFFFPEIHQRTSVGLAVEYAMSNNIKTVAIEGIPQGVVTAERYKAYKQEYTAYKKDLDLFVSKIDSVISFQDYKKDLKSLIGRVFIDKEAETIYNQIRILGQELLNAYASNKNNIVGNQFRYCKPLMDKGITVVGMEDPELYKKTRTEVYKEDHLNNFFINLANYRSGLIEKRANNPELLKFVRNSLKKADGLFKLAKKEDLLNNKFTYGISYKKTTLEKRKDVGVNLRTKIWFDYLKDFNRVMVIFGKSHLNKCNELAKKQKRTHQTFR